MVNGKKVIGIVCEFNPFHEGHKFLIDNIKNKFPSSYIVCVMSGDFVQRGECAIVDKYIRTNTALKNNIDLIIEMPVEFATSSAKDFAKCGVSILDELKYVDYMAFGAENPNEIIKIKNKISKENMLQSKKIKELLKNGFTYAKAISTVFELNIGSNDILAIEYLKAIDEINANFKTLIIQRNENYVSAHEIRNKVHSILEDHFNSTIKSAKNKNSEIVTILNKYPLGFIDDFSEFLNYKLLDDLHSNINFTTYYDVKVDLANAIQKTVNENLTFTERVNKLKSKNYTYAYISRCLLHIMLGIKKEHVEKLKNRGYFEYIRFIGVKKEAQILLKQNNPLCITGVSEKRTSQLKNRESLELNTFSSNIYNLVVGNNQNEMCRKFMLNML